MSRNDDFYKSLRRRVDTWLETGEGRRFKWAEHLLVAPDVFHLLCRLSLDAGVPLRDKAVLATAIAYWVSPLDLLPEALLGVVGYGDDLALAAYVLNALVNRTSPDLVRRHWAGKGDVLEVVRRVLAAADGMVGSGLWKKLRGLVG